MSPVSSNPSETSPGIGELCSSLTGAMTLRAPSVALCLTRAFRRAEFRLRSAQHEAGLRSRSSPPVLPRTRHRQIGVVRLGAAGRFAFRQRISVSPKPVLLSDSAPKIRQSQHNRRRANDAGLITVTGFKPARHSSTAIISRVVQSQRCAPLLSSGCNRCGPPARRWKWPPK